MRKQTILAALAFLPLLMFGDEQIILNTPRGFDGDVVVSPNDHTSSEVVYHPPFGAKTSSLLYGLTAYWSLDETSGTRAKTAGSCESCDLTSVNSASYSGGSGSYAMLSEADKYLTVADDADLSVTGAFGVCAWIRPSSVAAGVATIVAKDSPTGNREFALYRSAAAVGMLIGDGTAAAPVSVTTGTMVAGAPVLACGWWNQGTAKANLSVNGAAAAASTGTVIPGDATNAFRIGTDADNTNFFTGVIGPVYFYEGGTPASLLTGLYNSGRAKSCAQLDSTDKTNMTHCWNLSEASGSRADSIGSETLTATNAPGRTAGMTQTSMGYAEYSVAVGSYLTSSTNLGQDSQNFALSVWINPTAALSSCQNNYSGCAIMSFNTNTPAAGDFIIGVQGNGALAACHWATAADLNSRKYSAAGLVTANTWSHYVFQRKSGTYQMWLNGSAVTIAGTTSCSTAWANGVFRIAENYGGAGYRWVGAVDGAGIWNRALNDAEIAALYAAGAGVEYPWASLGRRTIYARYGVEVPEFMFRRREVYVR